MRRPHPSTGAWICIGLIGAAVVAPVTVYAAASSTVAIGNPTGTLTAKVTKSHQLLTTPIEPSNVVSFVAAVFTSCKIVYTPPAGKAIVVTDITFNVGTGVEGQENFGGLFGGTGCSTIYDQFDTTKAFDTLQHTFPIGLPLAAVSANTNSSGGITIFGRGYLIPAADLPAAAHAAPQPLLPKSALLPKG